MFCAKIERNSNVMSIFFVLCILIGALNRCDTVESASESNDCLRCLRKGAYWQCVTKCSRLKRSNPITTDLKNTPCAPNDNFNIDCNTCRCNAERTGYICTEFQCNIRDLSINETESSPTSGLLDSNGTLIRKQEFPPPPPTSTSPIQSLDLNNVNVTLSNVKISPKNLNGTVVSNFTAVIENVNGVKVGNVSVAIFNFNVTLLSQPKLAASNGGENRANSVVEKLERNTTMI